MLLLEVYSVHDDLYLTSHHLLKLNLNANNPLRNPLQMQFPAILHTRRADCKSGVRLLEA